MIQAVKDLKQQIADKGQPQGDEIRTGSATPDPAQPKDSARYAFAAHFAEVEVDTELGHARVVKYLAAHDSGRIINPLTCTSQVKGGSTMGIGMEDQYGPFGAKSIGEASIIPSVAAVANAIFNATGKRIKDLPITRDKLLGVLA